MIDIINSCKHPPVPDLGFSSAGIYINLVHNTMIKESSCLRSHENCCRCTYVDCDNTKQSSHF